MSYENLLVLREDPIAIVQLHRPKVLNALNRALMQELVEALQQLDQDDFDTLSTIENRSAKPTPMQYPSTLPVGAGNRWRGRYRNFYPRPLDPVLAGPDGPITFD